MKIVEWRGVRKLVGALLTADTAESLTYGVVFPIAGTSRLQKTTESSSDTHYYDNIPAVIIDGNGSDTVTIDSSAIDSETFAKITGQYYSTTTGTLVEGAATRPYLAIGYITEDTDGNEVYVWRLKGKFAIPGSEHGTKNNSTDANGQQLVWTGVNTIHEFESIDNPETHDKTAKAVNLEVAKELTTYTESTFFAAVQDPDKIEAKKKT